MVLGVELTDEPTDDDAALCVLWQSEQPRFNEFPPRGVAVGAGMAGAAAGETEKERRWR